VAHVFFGYFAGMIAITSIRLVQMEELHQHVNDELHRRVVVVVHDDDVAARLLDFLALDDPELAFG
jgi:hypothetical protein